MNSIPIDTNNVLSIATLQTTIKRSVTACSWFNYWAHLCNYASFIGGGGGGGKILNQIFYLTTQPGKF
jgi:hypothetical protein